SSVKGTRGADGTWTFDASSLVQGKGASTFFGLAMVPAPAAPTDGWEVVWSGSSAAATYAVSGAATPAPSGSSFLAPPAASTTPTGSSGGSSSGSGSSAGSGSSLAPASSSGSSSGSSFTS